MGYTFYFRLGDPMWDEFFPQNFEGIVFERDGYKIKIGLEELIKMAHEKFNASFSKELEVIDE